MDHFGYNLEISIATRAQKLFSSKANFHSNIDGSTTNVDFFFLLYKIKIRVPHIFTSHASTSHKDLHCQSSHHAWRSGHDRLTGCHV